MPVLAPLFRESIELIFEIHNGHSEPRSVGTLLTSGSCGSKKNVLARWSIGLDWRRSSKGRSTRSIRQDMYTRISALTISSRSTNVLRLSRPILPRYACVISVLCIPWIGGCFPRETQVLIILATRNGRRISTATKSVRVLNPSSGMLSSTIFIAWASAYSRLGCGSL
jgi:hypothetical protein